MSSHNNYVEAFRRQSLGKLEEQYMNMKAGPNKMQVECDLLRAQIDGLLNHRPEGFGGRIEQLRAQLEKFENVMAIQREQVAALEQVIEEKRLEFK